MKNLQNLLRRLERQRHRLAIDLQIMEMADGYRHMMACPQYQTYLVLKAECERLKSEIAKRKNDR